MMDMQLNVPLASVTILSVLSIVPQIVTVLLLFVIFLLGQIVEYVKDALIIANVTLTTSVPLVVNVFSNLLIKTGGYI